MVRIYSETMKEVILTQIIREKPDADQNIENDDRDSTEPKHVDMVECKTMQRERCAKHLQVLKKRIRSTQNHRGVWKKQRTDQKCIRNKRKVKRKWKCKKRNCALKKT